MTIFVVEADPDIRALFAEALSFEGYQVQFRDLQDLEHGGIAASNTDLLMLELTPADLARTLMIIQQLRRDASTSDLPVLVCATDVHLLNRFRLLLDHLGCARLLKPFDLDFLLQTVRMQTMIEG